MIRGLGKKARRGRHNMFVYEKKLQYPVKIKTPNARLAKAVISQLGGPDGESGLARAEIPRIGPEIPCGQIYPLSAPEVQQAVGRECGLDFQRIEVNRTPGRNHRSRRFDAHPYP